MRMIDLRGPLDAVETHEAWARRWARMKRAARAVWLVFQPLSARRQAPKRLEFYAEAGAPEGALYVDGRLGAQLEGIKRL
ncbi:MAG: hypothetical protein HY020_09560 [Burkholderiales bacterium]|nr:hypothetical protein [Burkholderiales bacterium]